MLGLSWRGHRANHLLPGDGTKAAGANILFLDGRVDWRPWREDGEMKIRQNNPDQWF